MAYKLRETDENVLICEGARVAGDVTLGKGVSVWYNAVLRGDEGAITVGENTNIQDGAVMHEETVVGSGCTIGHNAIVHGCTMGDNVLIGMNATVLTGAKIGHGSIIAAGALVKENAVIPPNSLVVGVPGVVKRTIDRMDSIHAQAVKYKTAWAKGYGVAPNIGGELYHGEQIV